MGQGDGFAPSTWQPGHPDGAPRDAYPLTLLARLDDPNPYTFRKYGAGWGGLIDMSTFPDGRTMIFNEEGKLLGLLPNVEATIIYRQAWKGVSEWAAADTIVCDVLLCSPAEVGD
jgi:hypothetical protein